MDGPTSSTPEASPAMTVPDAFSNAARIAALEAQVEALADEVQRLRTGLRMAGAVAANAAGGDDVELRAG